MGNEELYNRLHENIQYNKKHDEEFFKKFNKFGEKNSILGETSQNALEGVGQSTVYAGMNLLSPVASTATMFASSAGSSLKDSYSDKDVKDWQAWTRSTGAGAISALTENLFSMFGVGGSGVDDALKNQVSKKFGNGIAKALARTGISAGGEGAEEFLEYFGDYLLDSAIDKLSKKTGDKSNFAKWDWEELGENVLTGFLSGGIAEGASNTANIRVKANKNIAETQQKIGRDLTAKEKGQILEQTTKEMAVREENMYDNEKIIKKSKLSNQIQEKLTQVAEENNLNPEQVQYLIDNTKNGKYTQNQPVTMKNETILNNNQQIPQQQDKMAENGDIGQIEQKQENEVNPYRNTAKANKLTQEKNEKIAQLNNDLKNVTSEEAKKSIQEQIKNTENNYNTQIQNLYDKINQQQSIQENNKDNNNTNNLKEQQLKIISETNPMQDDYHTGIKDVEDIKTFDEAIKDDESFVYGDYTEEDAKRDLEKGTVTVYSSKPIENGAFVSTSQNMAKDYAGNGEIYSKEIPINDVAWINGDEGQYAKVENNLANNQEVGYNNVESEGGINESTYKADNERNSEKRNEAEYGRFEKTQQRIEEYKRDIEAEKKQSEQNLDNIIKDELTNKLPISKNKMTNILNTIKNKSDISINEINNMLKENNTYKVTINNDDVKKIRNIISDTKFNLSDSVKDELRYIYGKLPRNIKYSNDGVGIDSFYKELQNMFPGTFSDEVINESDIVSTVIDFMKDNKVTDTYIDNILNNDDLLELSNILHEMSQQYKEINDYYNKKLENSNESSFLLPKKQEVKLPQSQNLKMDSEEAKLMIELDEDMPQETKLKTYKTRYDDLQKAKTQIENTDIFSLSSEEWMQKSNELDTINNQQELLKSKIDELENIPDTANNIVRDRQIKKAFPQKAKEINAKFQKAFVNKFYEIDKIAKETKNKKLAIALDNWIGATQQVETAIDGKMKKGEGLTDLKGNVINESITEMFKDVYKNKDIIELTDYMQNKLNIERTKRNKANLDITPEQSKAIIERYDKTKPYLKENAEKAYSFLDKVLQNCVDSGLGTQEQKDMVRNIYPSYMPIYKNISELTSFIDNGEINNKMIKKAVGGQTDILAIDVAMSEYVMGMNKKIQLNNLLVELKNSLEKGNQLEEYQDTQMGSELEDFMSDKPSKGNEMLTETLEGDKIATCYIDGKAHQFKISDEIYNLLKPQTIKDTKFAEELISSANNLFRQAVTTYNPAFTTRNMIKDFQNGCYNTKYTAPVYMANYLRGVKEILTNGKYAQMYRNSGLQGNTKYTRNSGMLTKADKGFIAKYNPISLATNAIEYVNTNIETMGRMSEFISAIESGKDLNEARYEASEVTLNFKRGGETSKAITRWGGTFFNSSVLAIDKTIKNVTGKNGVKGVANFVTMGLLSGVGLSLLNHIAYGDDDDYEELPDYIKDGYWLIKKNDGSGTFYRIPKDQLTTAIGSTARRIYQMAEGEENIDELEDMFKAIFDNIGVDNPLTSNLYSGVIDASRGKTWYDGDLISDYQKTLAPELQYDYRTNELSKWTANQIAKLPESTKSTLKGLPIANKAYDILSSPKKSDYVLQQYSGGLGKLLLPKITPYAEENYIEKEATTNSVLKSKYPSMVYDEFDKAEIEYNSYGTNQLKYKYLDSAKKELSEYYTKIREIENDNTLTNEQKKTQEFEVRKELNKTAKKIINDMNNIKSDDSKANIGDKTYYKDNEGKWKEITDKNKIEGISTDTYADYKNKLSKATKDKQATDGEDAQLTDKEKWNILKNANYTDKEKDAIYTETGKGKKDEVYQNLKLINGNSPSQIDDYLNYKTTEIKGDENTKSKVKGATVKGSKKDNFIDYINTTNFNGFERLYLCGKNFKLSKDDQKKFDNYMNQSSLTPEEKRKIYLDMGYSVEELKDGSIRWK